MKKQKNAPKGKTASKVVTSNGASSGGRPRWMIAILAAVVFGVIGYAALRLSFGLSVTEDSPIYFTMGSQSIETADGNVWAAAGYVADGTPFVSPAPVLGTDDQKLYQTQRTGITSLKVPDLPNGRYKVSLLFADTESSAKGQRVFDLFVEGAQEKGGLDIFRKAGGTSKAYVYDFNASVKDGQLDIEFRPVAGAPILSAFELYPRKLDKGAVGGIPEPGTGTPPTTPQNPPTVPDPSPAHPSDPVIPTPLPGGGRQVNVSTTEQLTSAIAGAQPGDIINLADGKYEGKKLVGKYTGSFAAVVSGTADKPIVLKGSRNAVIESGGPGGRYGLYFVGANYWRVEGMTITNATKGVVLDGSNHNVFNSIKITQTGQEGIHFRTNSSDNTIMNSEISYTGVKNATYGEGIYFGSANSNWGTYNGGQPDKSDRNQALNNNISFTGAESMDIKEGTTGGIIKGNTINGEGMSGSWADSWLDVKGNNYTITDNVGNNALLDGFQVHVALKGWGSNNYFANNTANVNASGWGLSLQGGAIGNVWKCNNKVVGALSGNAVINGKTPYACTP